MSLFAIADLHLSLGEDKPMDVFFGWNDYVQRLEENWRRLVTEEDTVVIAGDISWAMKLEETLTDFRFIDSLPGKKLLLKGNHDYWWQTAKKLQQFIEKNNFDTIRFLHNNSYEVEDKIICGTRGWIFENGQRQDEKVILREAGRLKASLDFNKNTDKEKIVFLHYPPLMQAQACEEMMEVLKRNEVKRCYYGHLHGPSCNLSVNDTVDGIKFRLISADFLSFCPKLIENF